MDDRDLLGARINVEDAMELRERLWDAQVDLIRDEIRADFGSVAVSLERLLDHFDLGAHSIEKFRHLFELVGFLKRNKPSRTSGSEILMDAVDIIGESLYILADDEKRVRVCNSIELALRIWLLVGFGYAGYSGFGGEPIYESPLPRTLLQQVNQRIYLLKRQVEHRQEQLHRHQDRLNIKALQPPTELAQHEDQLDPEPLQTLDELLQQVAEITSLQEQLDVYKELKLSLRWLQQLQQQLQNPAPPQGIQEQLGQHEQRLQELLDTPTTTMLESLHHQLQPLQEAIGQVKEPLQQLLPNQVPSQPDLEVMKDKLQVLRQHLPATPPVDHPPLLTTALVQRAEMLSKQLPLEAPDLQQWTLIQRKLELFLKHLKNLDEVRAEQGGEQPQQESLLQRLRSCRQKIFRYIWLQSLQIEPQYDQEQEKVQIISDAINNTLSKDGSGAVDALYGFRVAGPGLTQAGITRGSEYRVIQTQRPADPDLDRTFSPLFTLRDMERLANFDIFFTDNLLNHLCLRKFRDRSFRTAVYVFQHASVLRLLRDSDHLDRNHSELFSEALRTLQLLIPAEPECQAWWHKIWRNAIRPDGMHEVDRSAADPPSSGDVSRRVRDYHFFRQRLLALEAEFNTASPRTPASWWHDRRDARGWATFWVALSGAVFALLALVLSAVSTGYGVVSAQQALLANAYASNGSTSAVVEAAMSSSSSESALLASSAAGGNATTTFVVPKIGGCFPLGCCCGAPIGNATFSMLSASAQGATMSLTPPTTTPAQDDSLTLTIVATLVTISTIIPTAD